MEDNIEKKIEEKLLKGNGNYNLRENSTVDLHQQE